MSAESRTPLVPMGSDDYPAALAKPPVGGTMLAGFLLIALFFGGFGTWAALAPIDSAVIASGTVIVEGSRKTIQHLEGGIVQELVVREGTAVEAGAVLIRLDPTQTRAQLELLRGNFSALRVKEARLRAERDGAPALRFLSDLVDTASDDPRLREMMAGQSDIFGARRKFVASQYDIHQSRIAQLEEEITGLEQQIAAQDRELALVADETQIVESLFEKGLERKPRLLALQRKTAEIEGRRASNVARIARAKQAIGETKLAMTDLDNRLRNEVVENLQTTQGELDELRERLRAAEDVLARTVIKAPVAGTVVGLKVFTIGGVVAPGASLMDIVPVGDRLIIEARIDTNDIEVVHAGQRANVRLVGFNQRTTPPVEGMVEQVSADALQDDRTGIAYYTARIALEDVPLGLGEAVLQPGMPAEVIIVTGVRTTLDYLLEPITGSLRRGMAQN